MRLKVLVTAYVPVGTLPDEEQWPGCKTVEDVARLQQEFIDCGNCMVEELLGDNCTVEISVDDT